MGPDSEAGFENTGKHLRSWQLRSRRIKEDREMKYENDLFEKFIVDTLVEISEFYNAGYIDEDGKYDAENIIEALEKGYLTFEEAIDLLRDVLELQCV